MTIAACDRRFPKPCAAGAAIWPRVRRFPGKLQKPMPPDLHGAGTDPAKAYAELPPSSLCSLRSHGVLKVGSCVFTVSESPDPCPPTPAGALPGESIVDEMLRRGGALRPVSDVRAELNR